MAPSRTLAAAVTCLTAVACSRVDAPTDERKWGQRQDGLVVCAAGPTVTGIDVSEWQGGIDWPAVAGTGIAFAITRINDGWHHDPTFATNWAGIKAAGLVRGAYQFYEPSMSSVDQANMVVTAVGRLGAGDLPVVLDVEWPSSGGAPTEAAIRQWADLVEQGTGKKPLIYTAIGYWNQFFNGQLGDLDLWVANYGVNCPAVPSSWSGWKMWQWGGTTIAGIGGQVDHNVFNGTLQDLQVYADGVTRDACTGAQAGGCGNFGCGCADGQCSGVFCPGTGCSAQHTQDCGNFGCGCADGQCSGVFCPGSGCTARETLDCAKTGCGCVDHQCKGGDHCAGNGCTAREVLDCGNFGCNCVDHQCSGGFCNGNGCTGKETADCQAQGCGCVDHACSGGKCGGSGATARQALDCGNYGCGAVDGQCNGGFCPGTGCTAKQTADCAAQGCGCADQKCGGGACAGTGCTGKQALDCQNQGKTCAQGQCVASGATTVDAGVARPDAGAGRLDAGAPASARDAGAAAPGSPDAGHEDAPPAPVTPEGGGAVPPPVAAAGAATTEPEPPVTGSCAAVPGTLPLTLLAALVLLRRRRDAETEAGRCAVTAVGASSRRSLPRGGRS